VSPTRIEETAMATVTTPPPPTPTLRELLSMARALRDDNEFDLTRLRGLLKVATS